MIQYEIIVDYGRPYSIKTKSIKKVHIEINKLRKMSEREDYSYFDVDIIYKKNGKSVALDDEQFDDIQFKGSFKLKDWQKKILG